MNLQRMKSIPGLIENKSAFERGESAPSALGLPENSQSLNIASPIDYGFLSALYLKPFFEVLFPFLNLYIFVGSMRI